MYLNTINSKRWVGLKRGINTRLSDNMGLSGKGLNKRAMMALNRSPEKQFAQGIRKTTKWSSKVYRSSPRVETSRNSFFVIQGYITLEILTQDKQRRAHNRLRSYSCSYSA